MSALRPLEPEFVDTTIERIFTNPQKTTKITVEDDQGHSLYESADESLINKYISSRHCGLLEAIVFPIRSGNIADFFPLVNRTHHFVLALLGDCITLPIRLLTAIPRIIFNSLYKHPLTKITMSDYKLPHDIIGILGYGRDREAYKNLSALQEAVDTGRVNVVVRTTRKGEGHTGDPNQIDTTTRYQVYTKPTLDPQRVERTITSYYGFFGNTLKLLYENGKLISESGKMPYYLSQ